MKFRVILMVALVALIVTACAPPPNLRDEGFLKDTSLVSGEPCAAPCWRNIIPGETSWNEALTIVEDSADLTNQEIPDLPDTEARLVDFDAKDGKRCCRVYSGDGITVSSVLTLLAPNQMTFGEVIAKYGEPQFFAVEAVTDDQALVSVLLPDVPLIVYVFSAGLTQGEVLETSEVIGAIYLTPTDMQAVLTGSNLYNWTGYGKLSEMADGTFDVTPVPTDALSAETTPEASAEATESGN